MLKNTPSKVTLNYQETQEETDPEGYTLIYEQEIVCQIVVDDGEQQQTQETLNVRVLILGSEQTLEKMKIELSCENDLFFHFIHEVNEETFQQIKEGQQLTASFIDYPAICVKCLDKAHKDPNKYSAVLRITQEGDAVIEIIQHTEYKNVELIQFQFVSLPEESIRMAITKKYQKVKQKLQQMENKLKDINDVVKVKNPQLLLQMQRMNR
ncbi:unnamed protein product (macronuclear) [Paramecium tetraurelia]|uniref:Spindle assembly abnormal protein 6 N-terminal domain-containing protein n=2 Tax=Paramecium TaxID=5884 RepID=A0CUX0_PARTE|nr:uncharacterized protein GSPATT00010755001 [Paramecium tetraurelia]CAD8161329.1 unnamed protein product [Paramecium octaurelia]CAK74587.1 unnamed protein product [Paramecium tetraurelia]|eukprot:XP_001441984.1 hypothetical protein (macronuclear) [Paramecium tetraurelia strain d4-2]